MFISTTVDFVVKSNVSCLSGFEALRKIRKT